MIVRIWHTEIDPERVADYNAFARSKSLPMFRSQPGFRGVLFASQGAERSVITLWADAAAVDALDRSPSYAATVAEIEATGFLRGESWLEIFDADDGYLADNALGDERD